MNIQIDTETPVTAGALTLFRLYSPEPEAAPYVTGPDAAERKLFDVHEVGEGGNVPELQIENHAELPLLLVEGEILVGVKQTRTINVSLICAPGKRTVIPVSCVEAGRWGSARKASHSRFHASASMRKLKSRSVRESILHGYGKRSDQGEVWRIVDETATRLASDSPTRSYDEIVGHAMADIEKLVAGIEPAEGQRGVLVGIGGRVSGLDLFDRPSTLRAYWKGLLSGYASDAIGEQPVATSAAAAQAFLRKLAAVKFDEAKAVGLGAESHAAAKDVGASALRWGSATVHLAAFAA